MIQAVLPRVLHPWQDICFYKPSEEGRVTCGSPRLHGPEDQAAARTHSCTEGSSRASLTQSLCRELFMEALIKAERWCNDAPNVSLVGQFHDEIVLDWWPDPAGYHLVEAKAELEAFMSDAGWAYQFPLDAEVKDDYRYTK